MIKKIIFSILGLSLGGAIAVDFIVVTPTEAGLSTGETLSMERPIFTDKELDQIKKEKKLKQTEDFIYRNVINNKKLVVDLSKTSVEEITDMYLDVLFKIGDNKKDFLEDHLKNGNSTDLDKRIKKVSKDNKVLLLSEK